MTELLEKEVILTYELFGKITQKDVYFIDKAICRSGFSCSLHSKARSRGLKNKKLKHYVMVYKSSTDQEKISLRGLNIGNALEATLELSMKCLPETYKIVSTEVLKKNRYQSLAQLIE